MVSGEKFGRLTTIRELPERNYGHVMWECQCECGNITKVQRDRLLSGHTRSCGCGKTNPLSLKKGSDITGKRIGRLVVLEWVGSKRNSTLWRCKCDCGKIKDIPRSDLMSGRVFSCGCLKLENQTKHGCINDRLYKVWVSMRDRCNNPNNRYYANYGGRGVRVCKEWNDYLNFKHWAMNNGYDPDAEFQKCTIDRIDVNGNYEPDNCRIVDFEVQINNTTRTIRVEMDGTTKSLKQWCNYLGCNYDYAYHRKTAGKDVKEWFNIELPYKNVKIV